MSSAETESHGGGQSWESEQSAGWLWARVKPWLDSQKSVEEIGVRQQSQRCRWKVLEKSRRGEHVVSYENCKGSRCLQVPPQASVSSVRVRASEGCLPESAGLHPVGLECSPAQPQPRGREKSNHVAIFRTHCWQSTGLHVPLGIHAWNLQH